MMDSGCVASVLSALAQEDGEPARRAWAALAGMTTRKCGRYSAEARAVDAARAAGTLDPERLGVLAGHLARRARSDARFASAFAPWLAAADMLLPRPGEGLAETQPASDAEPGEPPQDGGGRAL